jgi:hypothetical protein
MRAWEFMRPAATEINDGDDTMQPEGSLDAAQRQRSIRPADTQRTVRDAKSRRAAKLCDPTKSRLP